MHLLCTMLLLAALGVPRADGKSIERTTKSFSLPLHRQHVSAEPSVDAELPLKVQGIEGLVYTVDIQVGSQRFNLTLDTNAQYSVLFAKGYAASEHSCGKSDAQRHLFDPSLSTSFGVMADSADGTYLNAYPYVGFECHKSVGFGINLYGLWATDTYQFGDYPVANVLFVLANHTFHPLNPRWASDGVLPLGLQSSQALQTILKALGGNQEVSLFLDNTKLSESENAAPGGRITFGSKNTQDCSGKWITLNSEDTDWYLMITKMNIGSKRITGGLEKAQISTASPFLVVPSIESYFRDLMKVLGGQFSDDVDMYTVDCSKVDFLPHIDITLGSGFGLAYSVRPEDYVVQIKTPSGTKCALLIVEDERNDFLLGTQFLPKRCVHMDYDNAQISFADPPT